jgi:hypothetical protein
MEGMMELLLAAVVHISAGQKEEAPVDNRKQEAALNATRGGGASGTNDW